MKYLLFLIAAAACASGLGQDSLFLSLAIDGKFNDLQAAIGAAPNEALESEVWQSLASSEHPRAQWAQVNDSALSVLFKWTAAVFQDHLKQTTSDHATAASALPTPEKRRFGWQMVWFVSSCLALSGVSGYALKERRKKAAPLPSALDPLARYFSGEVRYHEEAKSVWANWKQQWSAGNGLDFGLLASFDLSQTEMEVLTALSAGRTTDEIAKDLACTPSYVYNVRSRIRKKLDLPVDVDLERHIEQLKQGQVTNQAE